MFQISKGLKLAVLGAALAAWTVPAAAAPVTAPPSQTTAAIAQGNDGAVEQVRWRGRHYYRHHYYHRHHHGAGAAIAAGVGAAIIGGAIAAQAARSNQDAINYCLSRYRSYRPETGTYTGYDGLQHPCP